MTIFNRYLLTTAFIAFLFFVLSHCSENPVSDSSPGTPPSVLPTISTVDVNTITNASALCSLEIISDGGSKILAWGIVWGTEVDPVYDDSSFSQILLPDSLLSFTTEITSLNPNTTYFARAFAQNALGTNYGTSIEFITLPESGEVLVDIEGNEYLTVTIGTQVWMAENLRVRRFRNGDPIAYRSGGIFCRADTAAHIPVYNDSSNLRLYGRLYNRDAVNDRRNIAPEGWHIPTRAEMETLIDYVGGISVAGRELTALGLNPYGFSAQMVGTQDCPSSSSPNGYFGRGSYTAFWLLDPSDQERIRNYVTISNRSSLVRFSITQFLGSPGYSIRCIRDDPN